MNPDTKRRREEIKNIRSVADYHALMDSVKLTPTERTIADFVFIDAMPYAQIADRIGYSERTVKRMMRHVLTVL